MKKIWQYSKAVGFSYAIIAAAFVLGIVIALGAAMLLGGLDGLKEALSRSDELREVAIGGSIALGVGVLSDLIRRGFRQLASKLD